MNHIHKQRQLMYELHTHDTNLILVMNTVNSLQKPNLLPRILKSLQRFHTILANNNKSRPFIIAITAITVYIPFGQLF